MLGAPIYQDAKTGGYPYQAHLRAEISERLGLEWGPVRKGAAELKDVPQATLEEFSRRRHEMQRAAAEGGFSLGSKRSAEDCRRGAVLVAVRAVRLRRVWAQ